LVNLFVCHIFGPTGRLNKDLTAEKYWRKSTLSMPLQLTISEKSRNGRLTASESPCNLSSAGDSSIDARVDIGVGDLDSGPAGLLSDSDFEVLDRSPNGIAGPTFVRFAECGQKPVNRVFDPGCHYFRHVCVLLLE
jgi:hypothetical protein